jgi:hypothetical protein
MTNTLWRRRFQLTGVAVLGMSAACSAWVDCTLIGCSDMLVVEFDAQPSTPFRVEVTNPFGTFVSIDCPTGMACRPNGAAFPDFTPATATVKVITAAGTTTTTVSPAYTNVKPNGEHCGPTCRIATVKVLVAK